jgi:hypothetical protein
VLDGGQAMSALGKLERIAVFSVCLALRLLLGESVFALVAGGACWRLFTKDIPEKSSLAATSYFVALIVLLALVLRITPGHDAGMR